MQNFQPLAYSADGYNCCREPGQSQGPGAPSRLLCASTAPSPLAISCSLTQAVSRELMSVSADSCMGCPRHRWQLLPT